MSDVFGSGFSVPGQVDSAGSVLLRLGEDRILDAVNAILSTPIGTCPLDPKFGVDIDAYDPIDDLHALAHALLRAIEYGEPRAEVIKAVIEDVNVKEGEVRIRIEVTPNGSVSAKTRTYPFYQKA